MTQSVDLTKRAAVVLEKFTQQARETNTMDVFDKAEVYLLIDHSGSMTGYFRDSRQPVVALAKAALALALARLDPDGKIPMWFFASDVEGPWIVTEDELYPAQGRQGRFFKSAPQDIVTRAAQSARWGSTNLADGLRAVLAEHIETGLSTPGLAIVQTDGAPDNAREVERVLADASRYNLFFVFVGYGQGARGFLGALDRGGFAGQVVDNVATFDAGNDPASIDPDTLFDQILRDVPQWRTQAAGKVQGTV